tara:strand:+ start:937 stop:2826 length:1890 start_codon:yes stop_codon:yes gene_type:complete
MLTPDEKLKIIKESLANGFEGSIGDLIEQTEKGALKVDEVARTQDEKRQGLRGKPSGTSMAFTNSSGNFNTKGMTHNINIDKVDDKGNIVQSYKNVPPGIDNIPMGDKVGTVIETPGTYQAGGEREVRLPGSNRASGELKQFLEKVDKKMQKDEYLFNTKKAQDEEEIYLGESRRRLQRGGYKRTFGPSLDPKNAANTREGSTYVDEDTRELNAEPSYENQDPSTHLMAHDPHTFEAWPTLFKNKKTGKWYILDDGSARKEASMRGELYKFSSKEETEDFAVKGNWKKREKLQDHKILVDTYLRNLNFMHESAPKNRTSYISRHQNGGADGEKAAKAGSNFIRSIFNFTPLSILRQSDNLTNSEKKEIAITNTDENPKTDLSYKYEGTNTENSIYIKDSRTVRGVDGEDIVPKRDLKSGNYNKDLITEIIAYSKYYNLDPKLAIAIALQESNLGKIDGNLGHMLAYEELDRLNNNGSIQTFANDYLESHSVGGNDLSYIPYMAYIYNRHNPDSGHKYADVTDGEDYTIQRYNGTGNLYQNTEADYHGGNVKSFYGVDVPPNILYTEEDKKAGTIPKGNKIGDVKQKGYINMGVEKLYGKQIIDIRDNIINNNQDLLDLIDETKAYTTPK